MKLIKPHDIFKFAPPRTATCLTIYINQPSEVSSILMEVRRVAGADLKEDQIAELLSPVRYLLSSNKWQSSNQSVGIFVTKGFAGFMKIPFETKKLAVVSNSFHVKPLLKWMQREKPFFLLHLATDKATLFQGSINGINPVEEFNYKKSRSLDFALDLVEKAVHRTIQKTNQPLILSGNSVFTETYKNLSTYKMLLQQTIIETALVPQLNGLHRTCVNVLQPYMEKIESSLIKRYWKAKEQGLVSSSLSDILSMALSGKIKHLFINESVNIWGMINYKEGTFTYSHQQLDAHDDDILDDLAELVMFKGGGVTVLPGERMPDSQMAAAILYNSFNMDNKSEVSKKMNWSGNAKSNQRIFEIENNK